MKNLINSIFLLTCVIILGNCIKKGEENSNYTEKIHSSQDSIKGNAEKQNDTSALSNIAITISDSVKVDTLPYFADYKGYRYFFACGPCRDRFLRNPDKYFRIKKKFEGLIMRRKL